MADLFGIGQVVSSGIQAGANVGMTVMNNIAAAKREMEARRANYYYNEAAANNADARTRRLYTDLYGPQAQLEQIKAAGLSPSLFYGDGGGISGQTGAQGAGAAGISPTSFGIPEINFAGMAKSMAEIGLIKAQTKKTEAETKQTDLENALQEMSNTEFETEYNITNAHFAKSDGTQQSIYEIALESNSYKQFINNVRESAESAENLTLRDSTTTEKGQNVLRQIYEAKYEMQKDIAILSDSKTSAEFHKSITEALKKTDFARLNSENAIVELKKNVETNNLDGRQRQAFNNLLNKLEKSGSTTSDIVITLLLLVNNYISSKGNSSMIVK